MDTHRAGPNFGLDPALVSWIGQVAGPLIGAKRLVGGNRRQAWAIDCAGAAPLFLRIAGSALDRGADVYTLQREAMIYEALQNRGIAIPKFIAMHPMLPAFLMARVAGESRFARCPPAAQPAVARDVVKKLVALHAIEPVALLELGEARLQTMREAVAAEIFRWEAMYVETGRPDPLIAFALRWLRQNLPDTDEPARLVHGDAGPGNFLFEGDKVTALIDWELWHLGDPMEDFAWLSMRTTLEPFPDFPGLLRFYAETAGKPIAKERLLYHRVFVPLRVVIIRHRALGESEPDGDRSNSLISQMVNRRLLVEALHVVTGTAMPPAPVALPAVAQPEYEYVLALLRDKIAARIDDNVALAAVKSAARMVKFLAARDAHGAALAQAGQADAAALLGIAAETLSQPDTALAAAVTTGRLATPELLAFFARQTARETQLAAGALGALATRLMPPIE